MQDKIVLITGASRGIGAAVAKRFASLGAHVVLVARTVGGLEEVDDAIRAEGHGQATLVPLDLRKLDALDGLAVQLAERFGKLDVLVGNAGILGGLRPLAHTTNMIWDEVLLLNLTANWRLLRAVDPLLKKSTAGRAMFVTSGVTQHVMPFFGAYAVSKAGLEMMVRTYAAEVASTPVRINLIDPAIVRTNMRAEAMPGEDPNTLPAPEAVTDIFVQLADAILTANGERFHI
ncbi:MAG: SDR family NAD(P)-dependent oxidoreductase [Rickettsiales bacterium]|nr:SDR family NAD(P)-dependent oxidoreductase [Rickettsiales bacterium]